MHNTTDIDFGRIEARVSPGTDEHDGEKIETVDVGFLGSEDDARLVIDALDELLDQKNIDKSCEHIEKLIENERNSIYQYDNMNYAQKDGVVRATVENVVAALEELQKKYPTVNHIRETRNASDDLVEISDDLVEIPVRPGEDWKEIDGVRVFIGELEEEVGNSNTKSAYLRFENTIDTAVKDTILAQVENRFDKGETFDHKDNKVIFRSDKEIGDVIGAKEAMTKQGLVAAADKLGSKVTSEVGDAEEFGQPKKVEKSKNL